MQSVVVDLASGRSWRKLHDHPTVRMVPGHLAVIEGRPVPGLAMACDGIAIAADGERERPYAVMRARIDAAPVRLDG